MKLVREGRKQFNAGDDEAAVKSFRDALTKAPADFNANFGLGEILTRRLKQVSEGRAYLSKAKTTNPSSPALLLLEGFLEWQSFRETREKERLEAAITLTEECLKLAEVNMDHHGVRLAQGNLAYFLTDRNQGKDLDRALEFCARAREIYEKIGTREMSGLLDTYAFALLTKGEKDDVVRARQMLEDSIKRDPQNPYPHEHMAELIRKEQILGIKPISGLNY